MLVEKGENDERQHWFEQWKARMQLCTGRVGEFVK